MVFGLIYFVANTRFKVQLSGRLEQILRMLFDYGHARK